MSRDVCGICWCLYDENGACGCQTLDDAMQHPRAMAQAYENGYKAGSAAEREACAKLAESTVCDTHLPTGVRIYGTRAADAIRARG